MTKVSSPGEPASGHSSQAGYCRLSFDVRFDQLVELAELFALAFCLHYLDCLLSEHKINSQSSLTPAGDWLIRFFIGTHYLPNRPCLFRKQRDQSLTVPKSISISTNHSLNFTSLTVRLLAPPVEQSLVSNTFYERDNNDVYFKILSPENLRYTYKAKQAVFGKPFVVVSGLPVT